MAIHRPPSNLHVPRNIGTSNTSRNFFGTQTNSFYVPTFNPKDYFPTSWTSSNPTTATSWFSNPVNAVQNQVSEGFASVNQQVVTAMTGVNTKFDMSMQMVNNAYVYATGFATQSGVNIVALIVLGFATGAGVPSVGGLILGGLLLTGLERAAMSWLAETKVAQMALLSFASPKQIEDPVKYQDHNSHCLVTVPHDDIKETTTSISQEPSQFVDRKLNEVEKRLVQVNVSEAVPVQTFDFRTGEV
ncbi:MAG: hypothetical protein KDK63_00995, partial [Chlamydiia bacterium]|nr:hypothetical protein [Chlamydiia bacterium]